MVMILVMRLIMACVQLPFQRSARFQAPAAVRQGYDGAGVAGGHPVVEFPEGHRNVQQEDVGVGLALVFQGAAAGFHQLVEG